MFRRGHGRVDCRVNRFHFRLMLNVNRQSHNSSIGYAVCFAFAACDFVSHIVIDMHLHTRRGMIGLGEIGCSLS